MTETMTPVALALAGNAARRRWISLVVAGLVFGLLASDLSAASSTVSLAGRSYIVDTWDTDEGLPQNSVTSIVQTRDGYLWFGTLNGLVRFDGSRFDVFDENNTPGLNSSRIVKLFADSQGNLWIGTDTAGVALIKQGRVIRLGIGQEAAEGRPAATERRLSGACEDSSGAVWLYTADGQLWRHSQGRFEAFLFGWGRSSECRVIMAEASGPVWIGADWGLAAVDSTTPSGSLELPVTQSIGQLDYVLASARGGYWRLADGRIQRCRTNLVERDLGTYPWGRAPIAAACEDRQGNLVVGTLGLGVYWFDSEGQASRLTTRQGLSHDVILSLYLDGSGSLWVGTDGGGLNRLKQQVFEVLDMSRGSVGSAVQSVCQDAQGGLWIGSNGGGVAYWNEGLLQRFGPSLGLLNSSVWAVLVDRRQRVWAGTRGGGLFQLQEGRFQPAPGSSALSLEVFAIHQDRSGRLWLGTQAGLARWDEPDWKVFTTRDGLSSDAVRAIADDLAGNLWVGTMRGGLNSLRAGRFISHNHPGEFPSQDISSLHVDGEGVLWIGTFGSGLGRLHQGNWTRYTTLQGLISNSIGYLVEDGQGYLWLGSNRGLMRVRKQELNDFAQDRTRFITGRTFGKPDGMPTRECTLGSQPGGCRSRDGRLWFPTAKGLASVHPDQLLPNTNPPSVLIESVFIDGQLQNTNALRVELPSTLVVPPGKERLEIHFTGPNVAAPEKGRFQYQLDGHEKDWTEAGNSRIARYIKLPPGHYRFRVKACNEDGVWNEKGATLALVVEIQMWKTWWFLSATATGLLITIIAVVRYLSTQKLHRQLERLKNEEALEKERSRIARDIHDQLGASLTQVALLGEMVESDKNHPDEVEAHARQISQTARETTRGLDEIVWAVNPSNDTLEGLMIYVCKHAQEYLSLAGLRCRLEVPSQLPNRVMPPDVRHNVYLAFKEAVTNIVRHAAASAVWVRLRLESDAFILEVQDNGRGLADLDEKAARSRNGLRNMRKRMEAVGGHFALSPVPEGGALVTLTAPLENR